MVSSASGSAEQDLRFNGGLPLLLLPSKVMIQRPDLLPIKQMLIFRPRLLVLPSSAEAFGASFHFLLLASVALPGVVFARPPGQQGEGDGLTQSYNFRLCMTNDPKLKLPYTRPPGYREEDFELLARHVEALAAIDKLPQVHRTLLAMARLLRFRLRGPR